MTSVSLPQVVFAVLVAVSFSGHCMVQALRIRDTSNATVSGWDVSKDDERIFKLVIKTMNVGMDAPWTWKNARDNTWTFPHVKLTDEDPQVSLALHMLHRHGMAPWLAAMHSEAFEQHHSSRLPKQGVLGEEERVKLFIESQEAFGPVMQMKRLLETLSLSALRNLHSFDHDWSVATGKFDSRQPHCADDFSHDMADGPHMCALQAGFSKRTHALLQKHGVDAAMAKALEEKDDELMASAHQWASKKLSPYFDNNVMSPHFTGKVTTLYCAIDGAGCVLHGSFYWEDGGRSIAHVPVPKNRIASLYSGSDLDNAKVAEYVQEWLAETTSQHFVHMQDRDLRLIRWAAEQAELSQLCVQ